ncbi:redoxin family protein [Saccharibacter sp. 17.LH.SD]|uniref:redoxin family protein n=1 Tax=Saccharibacter sp. 17.LH.SD TaxID=2689393 RepID=UPI00136CA211|nr:redoxin family protein [Saccharibacter sp. 17.LH.SD]MXV43950.1 redoxin family protein [Saccharibacter sp. 17.LH.SD]
MPVTRRHLLAVIPAVGITAFAVGCARMLSRMQQGDYDPRAIHTPMLNQPIPDFANLPSLPGLPPSFDAPTLRQQDHPVLINFLASWCIPCVTELPLLKELSTHVDIWGIVYEDKAERVSAFLNRNDQPYQRVGHDFSGKIAIDWGVSGVPESFLIFPGGRIVWHNSAGLNQEVITREVLPLLELTP